MLGLYALATGLTGPVLVFEPELQAIAYPQYFKIADAGAPQADPDVVLGQVEQAYPGLRVSSVNWPTPQRNSFVSYPSKAGDTRTVFAHPCSGRVLGELPDAGLLYWIRELHVYLLAGRGGLRANGIAAGALVIVCLAGLLDVRPERGTTAGDFLMVWLFPLHAGWFGGLAVKICWAAFGLAFPVMFVTGAVIWWHRVLSPAIMPSVRAYSVETNLPP